MPLHNSCSYGHFEVSELLIKHGADVNVSDLWQFTPLHEAAAKMRTEVCSLLLAHGADPTLVNCHGKTVLDICPSRELQERILREHRGHQLIDAVLNRFEVNKLKKVVTADSVNFKHPFSGDTPLHVAVSLPCVAPGYPGVPSGAQAPSSKLRKQIVELLIRKSGNVNEKNTSFLTPLHLAAEKGHSDLIEVLLKHGAKINLVDSLNQTALHRAARTGQLAACQTLLSYGADLAATNMQGLTAELVASSEPVQKLIANHRLMSKGNAEQQLLEASRCGDLEVVRMILAKHAHLVNCRDVDGRQSTPLHFAAGYNRIDVVEYLLQHNADVHAKDKGGLGMALTAPPHSHYTPSAPAQRMQLWPLRGGRTAAQERSQRECH